MQDNKYQITKTVRFKLEPEFDDKDLINHLKTTNIRPQLELSDNAKVLNIEQIHYYQGLLEAKLDTEREYLVQIHTKLNDIINIFHSLVWRTKESGGYMYDKQGKNVWTSIISVKYSWMRQYMKTAFYSRTKKSATKDYPLDKLDYVKAEFDERWLNDIYSIIDNIDDAIYRPLENQARNASVALEINKLCMKSNFVFLKSFVDSFAPAGNIELDTKINDFKQYLKTFDEELKALCAYYLPYQSKGIQLLGGSFNYYTVNKTSKFDVQIKSSDYDTMMSDVENTLNGGIPSNIKNKMPNIAELKFILKDATLDSAYSIIKEWKANQKKEFLETLQSTKPNEAKNYELFDFDNDYNGSKFNNLKDLIQQRQKLSNELSSLYGDWNNLDKDSDEAKEIYEEIKNKKKEIKPVKEKIKNIFFFAKKNGLMNYFQLCDFYKNIALTRGQQYARIKSIEKEKVEAEKNKYWSLIVEDKGHKYLYMIPRDNFDFANNGKNENVYTFVSNLANADNSSKSLCYFESLTLSALRKLCFKGLNNSFYSNINIDLSKIQCSEKGKPSFEQALNVMKEETKEVRKGKFVELKTVKVLDERATALNKICFYQQVISQAGSLKLKSKYGNGINEIVNKDYSKIVDEDPMNAFDRDLCELCYSKVVVVNDNELETLNSRYNPLVFKITSLDIEHKFNVADKEVKYAHTNKNLTTLWESFWNINNKNDKYPVRLNPEIKVFWRDAKNSRVVKYGPDSDNYKPKYKNRYLNPQFTLATTITENCLDDKISYAFGDVKNQDKAIRDFNEKLNKNQFNYAIGIDVGTVDSGDLTIVKKQEDGKYEPVYFDVYRIKTENYLRKAYFADGSENPKPYNIFLNPSYFLDKELFKRTFKANDSDFENLFDENSNDCCFVKEIVCSINLTHAKVINGKIIVNGDLKTFEKLRQLDAERKISLIMQKDSEPDAKIRPIKDGNGNITGKNLVIKYNDGNEDKKEIVYRSNRTYDVVQNTQDAFNSIYEYYSEEKFDDARLLNNINNNRKALVANIVGVISFLYQQFSNSYIVLENLASSTIEADREEFHGNIARMLEIALYKKFQTLGLIPPFSEVVKLRENKRFDDEKKDRKTIEQIGIVKFVSAENTSLTCPCCGQKAYKSKGDEQYQKDKTQKIFRCNCGYNNQTNEKNVPGLKSNDAIAAFNIAKKAL